MNLSFGEAQKLAVKKGVKIHRAGWNGKNMYVVYCPGYPEGVSADKDTADRLGIEEGKIIKIRPYFMLKNVDDSFFMWVPSINDILANDWDTIY